MTGLVIAVLFLFAFFGIPLFLILGTGAMAGYLASGQQLELFFAAFYKPLADNPVFLAIPLFTLTGYLMAESRAPERLVRISRAWLGWLPGGLAMVALVACAGFTAFTGASGVTIVALGGLLLPALLKDGYPKKFTMGLLTSSGSRGIVFPPSLPLIVYAMIAGMTLQNVDPAAMRAAERQRVAAAQVQVVGQNGVQATPDAAVAAKAAAPAKPTGNVDDEIDKALAAEGGDAAAADGAAVAAPAKPATVDDEIDKALAAEGEAAGAEDKPVVAKAEGAADPVQDEIDKALAAEGAAAEGAVPEKAEGAVAEGQAAVAGVVVKPLEGSAVNAPVPPAEEEAEPFMQVTVDKLFVAGALPGLLALLMIGIYAAWFGVKHKVPRTKFRLIEVWGATKGIAWEIPIPIIIVGGILGGFFTAVDAAAFAAAYVFIVEVFIYKDVPIRKLPTIFRESMVLVGGILLILMSANALTNFFIDVEVPQKLFTMVKDTIKSPLTFLLILNGFLLIVGMLMDIFSAIMVVVPIIAPVAVYYGINPVHLGIIVLTNLEIGFNTPPVGVNLFVGALAFRRPVVELVKAIVPFVLISLIALIAITYWPDLSLYLIRVFNVK
jgi:TRAP-type C4-dicarboxylate transport system permease large subunit